MKTKSVKEIKEIIDNLKPDQYLEYIDILKNDSRIDFAIFTNTKNLPNSQDML